MLSLCHISSNYSDVELVCVDVLYCNAKCRLICVYRSTDSSHQSELFSAHLVQCLERLTGVTWPCYITGDFNAASVDWLNSMTTHHSGDKVIQDFTINNGFSQIVKYATRKCNILDIVLVNEPNTIFDVDVNAPFGCSDHCCVNFIIVIEFESSDSSAGASTKQPPMNLSLIHISEPTRPY